MSHLEKAKSELAKYDYVRFAICDLNGVSRGVVVPARNAAKYLEDGTDMFQGLLLFGTESEVVIVPHEKSTELGNMSIVPDPGTLRPIPWADDGKFKVAELLCEARWKVDNSPQEACPRYAARQQIKRLDDLGLQLYSGFEIEHFLFHANTKEPLFKGKLYMDHRNQNKHGRLLFDMDESLLKSGIDLERFHSEYAPGEFEAIMKPSFGIECPDAAFNLKQAILEISDSKNLKASFISKVDLNETGAGAHFSFSLISKESGKNVFYDANSPDKLSSTAKHWIAGILKHSRALTAFAAPTPNCYRRLCGGFAPASIYWNIEDRSSLLRAKNYNPSSTYLENRLPSGLSNPYLVVASTIAAGLDGVINKLECPPPGPQERPVQLPGSLSEAIQALQEDGSLVKALGEELVEWFVQCKNVDVKKFKNLSNDESMALERQIFF